MTTEDSPPPKQASLADLQTTASMALLGMLSAIVCELVRNGSLDSKVIELAIDHVTRDSSDDPQEQKVVDRMVGVLKKAIRAGEQK